MSALFNIKSSIQALLQTLAQTGAALVGYVRGEAGAVLRTLRQKVQDLSISVNDFGADPTGATDSRPAFLAAMAATPTGGKLEVSGYYRISGPLTTTKTLSIVGVDSRVGNVTSGVNSKSFIYFDQDTDGFIADGCVLTLEKVVVNGMGPTSTKYGVKTQNPNNSLILENAVVQGFSRGLSLSQGYYNKIKNSTLTHNENAMVADNCYNIIASGLTVNCNTSTTGNGIILNNGSSMTMLGGSIENHGGANSFGAGLFGGSGLTCIGTYFEGDTGRKNAWNVYLTANASFMGIGCHVYLTGCARHISIEGGSATGTRVLSLNTRFIYPTDAQACDVYTLLNTDTKADWKIGGDNWDTAAGPNVKYMAAGSGAVTYGVGNFDIQHPANHPLYGKNLLSTPVGVSGDWTPTPRGLTTAGAGTGTYTGKVSKVGNVVTVTGYINQTAHNGAGAMVIAGLPYASNNYAAVTIGYVKNLAISGGQVVTGYISPGGNTINIMQATVGGGDSVAVPVDGGFDMVFSCTYLAQ